MRGELSLRFSFSFIIIIFFFLLALLPPRVSHKCVLVVCSKLVASLAALKAPRELESKVRRLRVRHRANGKLHGNTVLLRYEKGKKKKRVLHFMCLNISHGGHDRD